ncbi:aminoacetone oxidase family FAD-binding enzyme [Alkalilimnicola ehrlichii]|uniref:Aminoacetone oxidase family FAD-binding enzyme n=1 Tax=Alkalilimnicola ehrlichii TaxID=351052 RepID=A0A3E0WHY7_9GAMM|nr:NAD(P)/FAD-dependent oxidoreductase [Alkalilimnicola ehrlichii]RFA24801.1 aminoacetone oxidase family FAD-binding enzyme [Alkalilimnicola ehrlichii]RFA32059.1 aminoacetone oxidase family FAD-binding enzyme [Alkalilimnicola ehrlichii]
MAKHYDVIVIGAGAAGLMCAIEAGKRGRRVLVLDHANKVGKKILLSGGGRCNFTNLYAEPANYLSENRHFCKSALSRYTQWDFQALVAAYGIAYEERKHGQLFCQESAKDIVRMLLVESERAGVRIQLRCEISAVAQVEEAFELQTSLGRYVAASLVVASGGLSFPKMGASGFGYRLARQFGLPVTETRPALVPFTLSGAEHNRCAELGGVSLEAEVSCNGQSFREALLFTHRGLSGPAILQISSYWREGDEVLIDLVPQVDLAAELLEQKRQRPRQALKTVLAEHLPTRFVQAVTGDWFENRPLADCADKTLEEVARRFHQWVLKPGGSEGYRTAEVTLGGVSTEALSSKTMMAKSVPGLYFVGEVVDVTGQLGGFNFQWAWASGWCAGQYV